MRLQLIMAILVEAFGSPVLDGSVHPFDFVIRPVSADARYQWPNIEPALLGVGGVPTGAICHGLRAPKQGRPRQVQARRLLGAEAVIQRQEV